MPARIEDGLRRRVGIRLDPTQWERFKVLCDERGISMSEALREAIDDLYMRHERGEL